MNNETYHRDPIILGPGEQWDNKDGQPYDTAVCFDIGHTPADIARWIYSEAMDAEVIEVLYRLQDGRRG